MTHVTTSSHPPSPMGPPRPLPTPPVTRSISRSAGSPPLVSSSSEAMNEYPHDLGGTYSCEVIEPGTEGTEIIPMRKETNDQLHNDEKVEIDAVGTPNSASKDPTLPSEYYPADEIMKEKIEEIDLTRNDVKERPHKRKISNRAQENSDRAQEALIELDRLMKQEYQVIKGREGSPEDIAKNAVLRYMDWAIENILNRMSIDEKKTYWNSITDTIATDNETRDYARRTMIQKLAEHVTMKEPPENTASTSKETGTIVTSPVMTPVELNKNLLNTLFKFNPLSKLKCFLVSKTGVEKTYYSLAEILTILKNIIKGEGMFDHANPSVIICSPELERALNMKALHVTEIRDLVLSQITKVPDQSLRKTTNISRTNLNFKVKRESNQQTQQQHSSRITRTANISTAIFTDKKAKFTLKPKFLKVVRLVPGINNTQTVFSYEEVTLLLSKYILARKKEIFDPRNIKLALVGNDPLGDAFGVKAFHRCQVNNLLRSQLIPVNSDYPPDVAIVIRTNRTNSGISGHEDVSGEEEEKRPLQEMEKEKESSIVENNDTDDNS